MNSDLKSVIVLGCSIGLGLGLGWLGYTHFYRRKKPYQGGVVSSLHIYPVKSCAEIELTKVEVEKLGLHLDRQWVLVNAKGIFMTQRQIPKMALIQPSFEGMNYLCLDAPGMPSLKVPMDIEDSNEKKTINLYGLEGEGLYCGDEASKWFDTFLGKTGLKLYSGQSTNLKRRDLKADTIWGDVAKDGDEMVYADGAPLMLLSEASLTSLNSHLENPVTMKSFRPNIVVTGCQSYDEDSWDVILIGEDVILRKLRPTPRCILTTVDPDSGTMRPNQEPLKTLKRVRLPEDGDKRCENDPLFGVLMAIDKIGTIKVGDRVHVLE